MMIKNLVFFLGCLLKSWCFLVLCFQLPVKESLSQSCKPFPLLIEAPLIMQLLSHPTAKIHTELPLQHRHVSLIHMTTVLHFVLCSFESQQHGFLC